jgi:hypothetical protein
MSANKHDCKNHLKTNNIVMLLQVLAGDDKIPALHINPLIYDREIGARARYANASFEQYLRKATVTGGNGTLKLNVALINIVDVESYHKCKTQKVFTDTVDDMFCITTDNQIALKLAWLPGGDGDGVQIQFVCGETIIGRTSIFISGGEYITDSNGRVTIYAEQGDSVGYAFEYSGQFYSGVIVISGSSMVIDVCDV